MSDNLPVSWAIANLRHPSQGGKAIQRSFDFSVATVIQGDLLLEIQDGIIDFVQSVKIDNSGNTLPCQIFFPGIGKYGDTVIAAAGAQLLSPVIVPISETLRYVASSLGGVKVPVTMLNIPMPYFVNQTVTPKSGVITGTETTHSGTIAAANVSQVAVPANVNRMRAVIQNPPANVSSLWIRTGVAATEDTNSQEILPGQEYDTANGPLATADIFIIGATLAMPYFATELHS